MTVGDREIKLDIECFAADRQARRAVHNFLQVAKYNLTALAPGLELITISSLGKALDKRMRVRMTNNIKNTLLNCQNTFLSTSNDQNHQASATFKGVHLIRVERNGMRSASNRGNNKEISDLRPEHEHEMKEGG